MSTNYTVIRSDGTSVSFDVDVVEQPNTSTVTFRAGGAIVATFVGFAAFYPTPATADATSTPAATPTTVVAPPTHGNAPAKPNAQQAAPTTTTPTTTTPTA